MLNLVVAVFVGVSLIMFALAIFALWLGSWLLDDEIEDTITKDYFPRSKYNPPAIFKRFWLWLNHTPPKLDYRRDKRGRFRKVRRG